MKRLIAIQQPQVIYNREPLPDRITKTVFLAGPTPRTDYLLSWRQECIDKLTEYGYDGIIIAPEERDHKPFNPDNKEDQIDWEYECMSASDCIIFWIPRQLRSDFEMIALTTNVEFGRFLNSHKLVIGSPSNAEKNTYLQHISKDMYEWHDDMDSLVQDAIKFVGDGIERVGAERKVPAHVFISDQFQNWYQPLKNVGNRLENFSMEYEFFMPKAKKMFLAIWHPEVYVKESMNGVPENRIKSNEFVIGRTDMSYICAYHKGETIEDTEIVVCEEFRSPVVNAPEMIFELPGGSSLKETDDRLQVASSELEEETGLKIDADRFRYVDIKQSSATLCSHRIALFAVELSKDEIDSVRNDTSVHGITEDAERIHLHVMTLAEAEKHMDWTNIGMAHHILQGTFR